MRCLLVFLGFIFLFSCSTQSKQQDEYEAEVFYVDVRTPEEFAGGSAENSVNIPLPEIEQNLDLFRDKEKIVVFCRSGRRSGEAIEILKINGITNVENGGSWEDVLNDQKSE